LRAQARENQASKLAGSGASEEGSLQRARANVEYEPWECVALERKMSDQALERDHPESPEDRAVVDAAARL
jgi:hypothetical protein